MADIKIRGVDDIVEALKHNKQFNKFAALLTGAGCSISAGIPSADQIVERIKSDYRIAYDRARIKEYPQCMAELLTSQRRDLIRKIISECRSVNWAHIGIAQLIRAGFVDRVLTVNFDPLNMKACAMAGEYPAIYDFTARQDYSPGRIADRAIFHLHGQHTGFVILNTEEEVTAQAARVAPVISDTGPSHTWIVVGYSGKNDPVFSELLKLKDFDHGLFWVGFEDEPAPHVRSLFDRPNTYFVPKTDADRFFIELSRKMGCFPPAFIGEPFDYLSGMLGSVLNFPVSGDGEVDVLKSARDLVLRLSSELRSDARGAKSQSDESQSLQLRAAELFTAENFEELRKLSNDLPADDVNIRDLISWSYIVEGNALSDQAATKQGVEADALFAQAGEKYAQALTVKPDKHEALSNWGIALSEQAKAKKGAEADALFAQAVEKYAQALAIKPDMHEALNNWGTALAEQAKTKHGIEADALFARAGEKFIEARAVKPDQHEALNNWGSALSAQARTKQGKEAGALFAQACDRYARALAIKPDKHEALYNWGNALSEQTKTKRGAEADVLFVQAGDRYAQALAIKPDKYEALNNWGIALSAQAKTKQGAEADALFVQAGEKYAQALAIKQDMHEALSNWGAALSDQAKTKQGAEADALFAQAGEKYAQALVIKPDKYEALNNWGGALLEQAKKKEVAEADALFVQAGEKYAHALMIKPAYHEALSNWGITLSAQAETKQEAEADVLFVRAGEKYAQALGIKPDDHEVLSNWGTALSVQAKTKQGMEADTLFVQAGEKYAQALTIKPDYHEALSNWSIALSDQAKTKQGTEADVLLSEAEAKTSKAYSINPGRSAYNFACMRALRGDDLRAVELLRESRELGDLPTLDHIMNDRDFDKIREGTLFQVFLSELRAVR